MNHTFKEHPSAEALQAFLEGEASNRERRAVEEHVSACHSCSAELDVWRQLFSTLDQVTVMRPHEGFADRVMIGVTLPTPLPWAARLRARVASFLPRNVRDHVGAGELEELLEGFLPARQVARIRAHLDDCASCATQVRGWQTVFSGLDALEPLTPSADFSNLVMARVRIPVRAPVLQPSASWNRALVWAGRLVPHTRQAWAALSGIAVTPAVTVGLLFYAVFSHPTLTPGSLMSFAWWQISDAAALAWTSLSAFALESSGAFGVTPVLEALAAAPLVVLAVSALYTGACAMALRVLYTNLIDSHPMDGRYAQASLS